MDEARKNFEIIPYFYCKMLDDQRKLHIQIKTHTKNEQISIGLFLVRRVQ